MSGGSVLLLSGGLDSTAMAAWLQPSQTLTIDYGQVSAAGEHRAARAVAERLDLPWDLLTIDCSSLGSGLLAGKPADASAPVPEWWPYRNQLLVTLAAAWALPRGFDTVWVASVAGDSSHRDGTKQFYERVDELVAFQEGGVRVQAPAVELTSAELLARADLPAGVTGFTHSCHRGSLACGLCPGCLKRSEVLEEMGWG